MEKSVKDVSLEEMFQAMYRHNFNEPELLGASTVFKCGEVSHEDQKFIEIVDTETSKKYDHYVIVLPFHDPSLMFPNNRKHAIHSHSQSVPCIKVRDSRITKVSKALIITVQIPKGKHHRGKGKYNLLLISISLPNL